MKPQVLNPGFLVSLKTSIRGGVNYSRVDTDPDHIETDGTRVAAWQTTRVITDAADYEAASVARSKARSLVTGVCCASSFGLLCPADKTIALEDAIAAARDVAEAYNRTAGASRVDVFVLVGRIAHNEREAALAIADEMRELLYAMQRGIAAADPVKIREAASKARDMGAMLAPDVAGRVNDAIAEARRAAREIVKRVEKSGETAAVVVAECKTAALEAARFAFLDLDAPAPVTSEAPAARGLDLEPGAPAAVAAPVVQSYALEL